MTIEWNSERLTITKVTDYIRACDYIEANVFAGDPDMHITAKVKGADEVNVFLDKAGAIELRDALNHFIQGTRP